MPWVCNPGGTLLVPSGETHHLFVILNAPANFETYPPQSCVLVSFSTIRQGPPTMPRAWSRPVRIRSSTRRASSRIGTRLERSAVLAQRADAAIYIAREPVSEQLRRDLISGLYASPLTPRYLKKLTIA